MQVSSLTSCSGRYRSHFSNPSDSDTSAPTPQLFPNGLTSGPGTSAKTKSCTHANQHLSQTATSERIRQGLHEGPVIRRQSVVQPLVLPLREGFAIGPCARRCGAVMFQSTSTQTTPLREGPAMKRGSPLPPVARDVERDGPELEHERGVDTQRAKSASSSCAQILSAVAQTSTGGGERETARAAASRILEASMLAHTSRSPQASHRRTIVEILGKDAVHCHTQCCLEIGRKPPSSRLEVRFRLRG